MGNNNKVCSRKQRERERAVGSELLVSCKRRWRVIDRLHVY